MPKYICDLAKTCDNTSCNHRKKHEAFPRCLEPYKGAYCPEIVKCSIVVEDIDATGNELIMRAFPIINKGRNV